MILTRIMLFGLDMQIVKMYNAHENSHFSKMNDITPSAESNTAQQCDTNPPKWVMYYAVKDDVQQGPYNEAELHAQVACGALPPDAPVWTEGMNTWQPYNQVFTATAPEGVTPPPLPNAAHIDIEGLKKRMCGMARRLMALLCPFLKKATAVSMNTVKSGVRKVREHDWDETLKKTKETLDKGRGEAGKLVGKCRSRKFVKWVKISAVAVVCIAVGGGCLFAWLRIVRGIDEKIKQAERQIAKWDNAPEAIATLARVGKWGNNEQKYRCAMAMLEFSDDTKDEEAAKGGVVFLEKLASSRYKDSADKLKNYLLSTGCVRIGDDFVNWLIDRGHATAALGLARYYYGYPKKEEALRWYAKADALHVSLTPEDAYHAADACREHAPKQMEQWMIKAAKNSGKYMAELGRLYFMGDVLPKDEAKANKYYKMAAKKNKRYLCELGALYLTENSPAYDVDKGIQCFKTAAEKGCMEGQLTMGYLYWYGIYVPQDRKEALKWCESVAWEKLMKDVPKNFSYGYLTVSEAGEMKSDDGKNKGWSIPVKKLCEDIGAALAKGDGVEKNAEKALQWYETYGALDNGKSKDYALYSQKKVAEAEGDAYAEGSGVKQNWKKAVEWYTKYGEDTAPGKLGRCYLNGTGVAKDIKKAISLLEKGDKLYLAQLYLEGKKIPANIPNALKIYIKEKAYGKLGEIYEQGGACVRDTDAAIYWYRQALENGDNQIAPVALRRLGEDVPDASQLSEKAEKGDAEAQYRFALCYLLGLGVERNKDLAETWFLRAVDQDYLPAMYELVSRDLGVYSILGKEGMTLIETACSRGYMPAIYMLGKHHVDYSSELPMYTSSNEYPIRLSTGVRLLRRAADEGDSVEACSYLARLYEVGHHVFRGEKVDWDKHKARKYTLRAAALGDVDCMEKIALENDREKYVSDSLRLKYLRKAAAKGSERAMDYMAEHGIPFNRLAKGEEVN